MRITHLPFLLNGKFKHQLSFQQFTIGIAVKYNIFPCNFFFPSQCTSCLVLNIIMIKHSVCLITYVLFSNPLSYELFVSQ